MLRNVSSLNITSRSKLFNKPFLPFVCRNIYGNIYRNISINNFADYGSLKVVPANVMPACAMRL